MEFTVFVVMFSTLLYPTAAWVYTVLLLYFEGTYKVKPWAWMQNAR